MKIQVLLLFQIMNSFCYEDFYTFFDENDNLDMKPKIIAGAEPLDLRHWNFIVKSLSKTLNTNCIHIDVFYLSGCY